MTLTNKERQELQGWAARLMEYSPIGMDDKGDFIVCKKEEYEGDVYDYFFTWAPDLDSSPAWQILSVIERMRKLGWYMNLQTYDEGTVVYFYPKQRPFLSDFRCPAVQDDNPFFAILLAAKATGVVV